MSWLRSQNHLKGLFFSQLARAGRLCSRSWAAQETGLKPREDGGLTGGALMSDWDAFQLHFLKHVYFRNKFFSEMQSK